jgi:MFS family permease
VLALWWLVLGPVTAMTFYEPAYIAIQQAFGAESRARALGVLTLAAGFSGPIFTTATGALVDTVGWRDATRVLAATFAVAAPVAALLIPPQRALVRPEAVAPAGPAAVDPADPAAGGPADPAAADPADPPTGDPAEPVADEAGRTGAAGRDDWAAHFRDHRVRLFTVAAIIAYGAIEATIVHRIARFQELGFSLATVTAWAAISGLLTLPGRFLLPALANRLGPPRVLALVLGVLAAGTGLMIAGDAYWEMALSFVLFGLVFGAALPLRPLVMGQWTPLAVFGRVMGIQAALIALGRAGLPALAGGLHDLLDGYGAAMALLTALLALSAALVVASARRR